MQKHKEFFRYCLCRSTVTMAKNFLIILEDLKEENLVSIDKYSKLRKKVLDSLGECDRTIESVIEPFDITLRKN